MAWEAPSEDCLYLTLATPAVEAGAVAANASLPVMVWLHGGGSKATNARLSKRQT